VALDLSDGEQGEFIRSGIARVVTLVEGEAKTGHGQGKRDNGKDEECQLR
jgi:hypothetical protein